MKKTLLLIEIRIERVSNFDFWTEYEIYCDKCTNIKAMQVFYYDWIHYKINRKSNEKKVIAN